VPFARVLVRPKVGLHARPAGLFVAEARKHACTIRVECMGRRADAKSILAVLALGANHGAEVVITTDGPGAAETLQDLVSLMEAMPETM